MCLLPQFGQGGLPWSYDQVWRAYHKATKTAGVGAFGIHSFSGHIPHLVSADRQIAVRQVWA